MELPTRPALSDQITADAAFSRLFVAEHAALVRMATLLVGSAAVAEEVVQDAFAQVRQRWASLDRPGGYLRTSVVNGCGQVLRRRDTERAHARRSLPEPTVELPTRLVELHGALDCLGERQRQVIVLRYFVDIPDDEIAELLEVRPATVRSLARRAFAVLRKELT